MRVLVNNHLIKISWQCPNTKKNVMKTLSQALCVCFVISNWYWIERVYVKKKSQIDNAFSPIHHKWLTYSETYGSKIMIQDFGLDKVPMEFCHSQFYSSYNRWWVAIHLPLTTRFEKKHKVGRYTLSSQCHLKSTKQQSIHSLMNGLYSQKRWQVTTKIPQITEAILIPWKSATWSSSFHSNRGSTHTKNRVL